MDNTTDLLPPIRKRLRGLELPQIVLPPVGVDIQPQAGWQGMPFMEMEPPPDDDTTNKRVSGAASMLARRGVELMTAPRVNNLHEELHNLGAGTRTGAAA